MSIQLPYYHGHDYSFYCLFGFTMKYSMTRKMCVATYQYGLLKLSKLLYNQIFILKGTFTEYIL
jgi:hypothetical protein